MAETTPQEEFVESLKEKLVHAGKLNAEIDVRNTTVEEGQKKAMENIAEAFSEPVKNFIDRESKGGGVAAITSADGTVSVSRNVEPGTGNVTTDLSVARTVYGAVSEHANRTDNPHDVTAAQVGAYTTQETEERISQSLDASVLKIAAPSQSGTNTMIFYRGNLA